MLNNKGFASIALIIIALIVLGGGYWVWQNKAEAPTPVPADTNIEPAVPPTPSVDMTNWKTYRNDKYGFELKYPDFWKTPTAVRENKDGIELAFLGSLPGRLTVRFQIYYDYDQKSRLLTFQEVTTRSIDLAKKAGANLENKNRLVDGVDAIESIYTHGSLKIFSVSFPNINSDNSEIISISYETNPNYDPKKNKLVSPEIFNAIVNSFKFTK